MFLYFFAADAHTQPNQWIAYFTSTENRHALPIFTSLLNVVCAYDPIGYGVPYNHLMFSDHREQLVEVALQVLCVTLDNDPSTSPQADAGGSGDHTSSDVSGIRLSTTISVSEIRITQYSIRAV